MLATASPPRTAAPRHAFVVRLTHWLTFIAFAALLVTGVEIVLSHPRFYWGEEGNVNTPPLFSLHLPSSRETVPTGYGYVLPDQNGWSRALHFEAAWVLVITGAVYLAWGLLAGHFRRNLFPQAGERSLSAVGRVLQKYLRRERPDESESLAYNVVQRSAYLLVIFVVFPMMIWTGLAMSPAFTAVVPESVLLLGGRQSARTLHFFLSGFLVAFLAVHVAMISYSGFVRRTRAMITGHESAPKEHA
jgi:thiosulfate reductase cytochrome b subunit